MAQHVQIIHSTSYAWLTLLTLSFATGLTLGYGCPAFRYFGTCCWSTQQGFGRTSATCNSCFLGNMKTVGWKQESQNKPFRRLKATARWKRFSRSMEAKADGKRDSGRLPTRLLCNFKKSVLLPVHLISLR